MSSLFNPDYLNSLYKKYGLRPSKKYGQNFLIDPSIIETIIKAADLKSDDTVVEVGPGFGILTLALAPHVKKVVAFEIEKKLEGYWKLDIGYWKSNNVEIIWGNILTQYLISNIQYQNYKVISNLPYQITSPVIRLFLESENPPTEMVLMVQKEVAERICAKPGDMSLLSVAVQYYADAETIRVVPRSSFWPVPGVDSAVIKVINKEQRTKNKEFDKKFFRIVKFGFAQRRKLLIKNLESLVGKKNRPALEGAFARVGLKAEARAQELSVEQWKDLVKFVDMLIN